MGAKMTKIADFAARFDISDRHARRLCAEYEEDLCGHIEKRGASGTWIDEYAVEFLRGKLRNPIEILPADTFLNVDDLKNEIEELKQKIADKNEQLAEIALKLSDAEERALIGTANTALLEAANSEKQALQVQNDELIAENASLEAQNRVLSDDCEKLWESLGRAEKRAEDFFGAYETAKKGFEEQSGLLQNTIDSKNRQIEAFENMTLIEFFKSKLKKNKN